MTRRLIRAEIEAQAGKRWADFILQQGEFSGPRDSYPPKPRPKMTPERPRPPRRTLEGVLQQVASLHTQGMGIGAAAQRIGFCDSYSLRRYLAGHGVACPWPAKPDGQLVRVPDEAVEASIAMRADGLTWPQISEELGYHPETLRLRASKIASGSPA